MKVTRLPDVQRSEGRSVAVGTFDGVHLGHREVIADADTVLSFDPHPVSVVAPQHTPKLLTTPARKAELIASLGVQEL
ncbi:MAG TPA: bifunctional riboflavin kinase/FMN adenylyltransferase, partial [Solirubrobacteraceae bacterium]